MFTVFQMLSIAIGSFALGVMLGAMIVLFIDRVRDRDPWDR